MGDARVPVVGASSKVKERFMSHLKITARMDEIIDDFAYVQLKGFLRQFEIVPVDGLIFTAKIHNLNRR